MVTEPTPAAPATVTGETVEVFPAAEPPASGITTTEFWKSLMVTAVGLGVFVFGVVKHDREVAAIGAGLAGVANVGYSVSRGLAKKRA